MGIGSSIYQQLCRRLYGDKELNILMTGLDAAGKTTILYKMKLGEVVINIPIIGFYYETVGYKNVRWTTLDVGGRDKTHPIWRIFFQRMKIQVDVLVFVVDSNDRDRISDCKDELEWFLNEGAYKDCVLLVLANKQDLPNAMSTQEITENLGLNTLKDRPWHIQATCATSGDGLYEGLEWLKDTLSTREMKKTLTQPLTETAKSASTVASKQTSVSSWLSSVSGYFHSRTAATN